MNKLMQLRASRLGAQAQKERRAKEVELIIGKAAEEVRSPLSAETLLLMGAALYWAEGCKTNMFALTNSDPALISFFVKWVHQIFDVPPSSLKVWMNIYEQQDEDGLKEFWSNITGIPIANFGKSFIKPTSKGFKKNNLYYGTIRISVPKSVDMRYKVFGWIKGAMSEMNKDIDFVQKKWQHLTDVDRLDLHP